MPYDFTPWVNGQTIDADHVNELQEAIEDISAEMYAIPSADLAATLDGSVLFHPDLTAGETTALLDEAVEMGAGFVILSAMRYKTTDCATDAYATWGSMPDHLGTILDACQSRGLGCYVGLAESHNVCLTWWESPNVTHDVAETTSLVTSVLASYSSEPALTGWYIVNEQSPAYETRATELAAQSAYFLAVRDAIRALDSTRPIIVAPYLANPDGIRPSTPGEFGQRVRDFYDDSGGDLIVWLQDSVGADAINLGWNRVGGEREQSVSAYVDAILAAGVPPDKLWGNLELFAYPVGSFSGPNYTATSVARLAAQLFHTRKAAKRCGWLATGHMTQANDARKDGADRLYDAYRAAAGISGEWVQPQAITYSTQPTAAFPDAATALLDRRPGDPLNPDHRDWTRFAIGGTEMVVDLGEAKTVKWAAVSCLNDNADGARFPATVAVATSPDGSAWTAQATVTPGWAGTDGEGVIGNTTALSVSCRYVRFTLTNVGYETLIDTVEIIAT